MNIQWFPGHMAKTRKQMEQDLKLVDIVFELTDARLPNASRNPEMDLLAKGKPRIMVLNKADLADEEANQAWLAYFQKEKIPALLVSSSSGEGLGQLVPMAKEILKEKLEANRRRGIVGGGIKAMIAGIPNVGKSTLINKLSGRASAKTGDRPGVTKGKQWITLKSGLKLLDTPGILWPKFEDESVGLKLAFSGAVRDEIMDIEEVAVHLISFLKEAYPQRLMERYKLEDLDKPSYEILEDLGRKRGFVISGGEIDTRKAAVILTDEFRGAKLGRITLEWPHQLEH